jgi:type IV pilus assembly protein PilA
MIKMFLKKKTGFTLTELMVVVAILGILIAIAVPIYNNVTSGAKERACEANVRTLESAALQYELKYLKAPEGVDNIKEFIKGGTLSCPFNDDATQAAGITDYVYEESTKTISCTCPDHVKDVVEP